LKFLGKNTEKIKFSSEKMDQIKQCIQVVDGSSVFVIGNQFAVGLTDKNGKVELFVRSTWGKQIEFKLKDAALMGATITIAKAECDCFDKYETPIDNRFCDDSYEPRYDSRKIISNPDLSPRFEIVALRNSNVVAIANLKTGVRMDLDYDCLDGIAWAMFQLSAIKK